MKHKKNYIPTFKGSVRSLPGDTAGGATLTGGATLAGGGAATDLAEGTAAAGGANQI